MYLVRQLYIVKKSLHFSTRGVWAYGHDHVRSRAKPPLLMFRRTSYVYHGLKRFSEKSLYNYFTLARNSHCSSLTVVYLCSVHGVHSITPPDGLFTRLCYFFYRYYLIDNIIIASHDDDEYLRRVSVFGVPKRPVPPPPTCIRPGTTGLRMRLCNLSRVHRRFRFDVFFTARNNFNVQ